MKLGLKIGISQSAELCLNSKSKSKKDEEVTDSVIDGKNSPLEIFTSCFTAFKLALSALSLELFLNASDKVLNKSFA